MAAKHISWQVARQIEVLSASYTKTHFRQRNPYVVPSPEKMRIDRILYVAHVLTNEMRKAKKPPFTRAVVSEEAG